VKDPESTVRPWSVSRPLPEIGFSVEGSVQSPLTGPKREQRVFIYLKKESAMTPKETRPSLTRSSPSSLPTGGERTMPENTIPAFEEARMGRPISETDVQITKDGVLVLAHDPHLGGPPGHP